MVCDTNSVQDSHCGFLHETNNSDDNDSDLSPNAKVKELILNREE